MVAEEIVTPNPDSEAAHQSPQANGTPPIADRKPIPPPGRCMSVDEALTHTMSKLDQDLRDLAK